MEIIRYEVLFIESKDEKYLNVFVPLSSCILELASQIDKCLQTEYYCGSCIQITLSDPSVDLRVVPTTLIILTKVI